MSIHDIFKKPQRNQGTEKYDVFISYRRDGGESTAKMMYDKLLQLGYCVFFDVESLRSGLFNIKLYSVIDECKDVVLILSPGALDRCESENDWVRREIEYAMQKEKNIVPIMLRGFDFPEKLPESMENLRYMQGLKASLEYFDAFVNKVKTFLLSQPAPVDILKKMVIACTSVAAVIVLIIGIVFYWPKDTEAGTIIPNVIEKDNSSGTAAGEQGGTENTDESNQTVSDIVVDGTETWESGGVTYTGIRVNGVIDGYGKAEYENGYYEGNWVNGLKEGEGTFRWNSGDRYEGDWENDKRYGVGTIYYDNGNRYEGDWVNDYRQGIGTLYYANEDKYEGKWEIDKAQGPGIYYFKNGDCIEGECKDNMWEGIAYKIFADESIIRRVYEAGEVVSEEKVEKWTVGSGADEITYYGKRVNGVIDGEGRAIYNNGYYEGGWVKGSIVGQGVFVWENGYSYDGEWKDGKLNGNGTMYHPDGTVQKGTWENDVYIGE